MRSTLPKDLLSLAVVLGGMTLLIPTQRSATRLVDAATTMPASAPASLQTQPAPAFAAMAYYDQNCAHCHGPQGSFYGPTLGQKLNDEQLIKVVNDMASGPGNAPLSADQLPVETAFHRALIMRTPYVSVTRMDRDGKWAGEAMPDAKVTIRIAGQTIQATHDDTTWSAQLPVTATPSTVQIDAELNGAATTLRLSESSFSSAMPLPPPAERPK